jgi:hypothetical protein
VGSSLEKRDSSVPMPPQVAKPDKAGQSERPNDSFTQKAYQEKPWENLVHYLPIIQSYLYADVRAVTREKAKGVRDWFEPGG